MSEFSFSPMCIELDLLPLNEDLEDIAATEAVGDTLKREITATRYVLRDVTGEHFEENLRSGGTSFELVSTLVQTLHDQQDVIKYLIGASITALTLILRQRRVKKVELKCGKKTLLIENADQHIIQIYLEQFQAIMQEALVEYSEEEKVAMRVYIAQEGKIALDQQKQQQQDEQN